jgi:hypothetical protein
MKNNIFVYVEKCPICESSEKKELFFSKNYNSIQLKDYLEKYYAGRVDYKIFLNEKFVINYCKDCDFYWHGSILNYKYLEILYSTWIENKGSLIKHYKNKSLLTRLKILAFLSRCINSQEEFAARNDLKFLDFGGGWGDFSICAKALGCDVFLHELSADRISYVLDQGIICLSKENLINFKNSFDFILVNQVLEHLPNPKKIIDEIYLLLKPGGIMFISVPYAKRSSNIIGKGPFQPLEHINCFTPNSLKKLLEKSNFTIINSNPIFSEISLRNIALNLVRKFIFRLSKKSLTVFDTSILCKK